jgi:lysozyme
MKIGAKGIALIKQFEGFKNSAYLDTGGVPTIGYGTTKGVKMGQIITESKAEEYLKRDVSSAEVTVNKSVKVPLTQNQFDALVCFVYNVGSGNFNSSTLLKLLNAGKYDQVDDQLLRWNKDNGKVIAGLTRRRQAEGVLFNTK